ncbi:hypothetical protein niasHT_029190 [Heterodera trifolii]|uniref:RING-type domain-containing protein n=1 Tax=Heterodera trifolii TaxID=157864 RepID=A0ABD2K011_9BILA
MSETNINAEADTSSKSSSIRQEQNGQEPNTEEEAGTSSNSRRQESDVAKEDQEIAADKAFAERIEEVNKRLTCIICMDKERNVLLLPCNHAVVCNICAEQIMNSPNDAGEKLCPFCRKKITLKTKIYLP